jgi:aspartate aminotransferase
VCDPATLASVVTRARAAGRRIGSVIVTLPDNPTGRLAEPGTVHALAEVAAEHDLVIISDEIYRDLVYDTAAPSTAPPSTAPPSTAPPSTAPSFTSPPSTASSFTSPAVLAPERTVVTTGLSKSLALGGWRTGVARLPDGPPGRVLRDRLLGIASEIWSAPAGPIQQVAALAFTEPPEITERIQRSRCLHATVCRAVAATFAAAGVAVPAPQAAFYTYPDFARWREHLAGRHGVVTGAGLATHLLDAYGMCVLPGSAFGEQDSALRLRVATAMLYGETDEERECALASPDPLALPPIAAALARLEEILAGLGP